jgi:iron(III) transport system ATP-binding protein
VTVAGTEITALGDNDLTKLRREHIGFVFQFFNLLPMLTAEENITLPLRIAGDKPEEGWVEKVVADVGLSDRLSHRPSELSGGQQQRVAVARALAPDFPVVLLDEPLSNLDASLRGSLRAELHRILKASGKTVLLVTHDREEAFEMADRIGVMSGGRLQQVGDPEDLHRWPATEEVARLVCDACFLPARRSGKFLSTELGVLPIGEEAPAEEDLMILVREDDVRLVPDESGEGVVENRVFRGPGHVIHVRLRSGVSIRCRSTDGSSARVGERVRVRIAPENLVIFPGNRG